ncbi:MAG: hypothetical protein ISQ11_08710 [Planctomycetes bacterium]|nr:hypothetical protein [Planctomycetota bacterium]
MEDRDPSGVARDEPKGRSARAPDPLTELAALGYSGWDEGRAAPPPVTAAEEASPWPRAFADDRNGVTVISVEGEVLRVHRVPGRSKVEFARFLPGGRIACVSVDEGLTLLAPDGEVLWAVDLPCHHEVALVPEGRDEGSRRLAVAVHHEASHRGRRVRFDEVMFLEESSGAPAVDLGTWSTWEQMGPLKERAAAAHPLDTSAKNPGADPTVYDYFHLNSIAFSGPRSMLVCLRNVDLVVEVDLPSGALGRSFGPGTLDWPHAPTPVNGGERWLIFDNGKHRGWSRVIEVDPEQGEIAWSYPPDGARTLFSEVRGFAQRLPGGTTLITESERGHVLEVNRAGDLLWEYWNPEVRRTGDGREARRRIYRMTAVPPSDVGP